MNREEYGEINRSLLIAVWKGNLQRTLELINRYGLSYCKAWSNGYVLLRDAIEHNHIEIAKLLLRKGSEVNSLTSYNNPTNTPLHFAVSRGNIEIVQMLLDKGAEINVKNQFGDTPLHIAFEKKMTEIYKLLLKYEADVNVQDNNGSSPFHSAVINGNLENIELLLKHGANINSLCDAKYKNYYAPLHLAVKSGRKEVVTLLLRESADVDIKGGGSVTSLHIAAKKGYTTIAEDLISHGACIHSITEEGFMPIHSASQQQNDETVKLLVSKGADINAGTNSGLTPLHIATESGNEGIFKLLLQNGAKVDVEDKDGKTVLHQAVQKGNAAIVDEVLNYFPDTNNQSNRNSLKIAMLVKGEHYYKICAELIKYGFTVSPEDVNDYELLHAAIEKGQLKVVEQLLKYGADVNNLRDSDYMNFTPLHTAANNKQEEIAKLLITYGADLSARDKSGKTPLFCAVENGSLEITNLILNYGANGEDGADVNASDENGRTALHCTAKPLPVSTDPFPFDPKCTTDREKERNSVINLKGEIAKLLLSKGANANAQTTCGETTLQSAIKNGHTKIVEALLEYNANLNINAGKKSDITVLHLSANNGNVDICTLLLNKGVNLNGNKKDGTTALHIATNNNHLGIVKILIAHGANVDCKDNYGITPLHSAAYLWNQCNNITETLLEFGADINSRDKIGRTALFIASKEKHVQVVETLLHYGSDINIKCFNRTPLQQGVIMLTTYNYFELSEARNVYSSHFAVAKAFKRHIIKLIAANLFVSGENLQTIMLFSFNDEISIDFHNKCRNEVTNLKCEKVSDANITFYNILAKDTSSLAIPYMRNDNIVKVLKSNDYKRKFPIYTGMIEEKFRRAMRKKDLLERANTTCYLIFESLPKLPYNCTEKILCYLNNEELRDFLDAWEIL